MEELLTLTSRSLFYLILEDRTTGKDDVQTATSRVFPDALRCQQ